MAYATKAGRIATLSSAYKTAVPLGLVDVNPFSSMGFTKPRGLETNRFAFTDQQMLAIVWLGSRATLRKGPEAVDLVPADKSRASW